MATIAIKILEILEQQFDPPKAKAIARSIEEALEENNRELENALVTKEDLHRTKEDLHLAKEDLHREIANLRAATKEDITNLRAATKEDITNLRAATKEDITNLRAELIEKITKSEVRILRWLVALWIAQMAAIVGILLK